MAYTLPKLAYAYDALEPAIDAQTVEIHYTKHHQAYVDKLNAALANEPELMAMSVTDLLLDFSKVPQALQTAVKNHGGGHANHTLYWEEMLPGGASQPEAAFLTAIEKRWQSLDALKQELTDKALAQFGSGWGWLVVDQAKELQVIATANQDSPLMQGLTPIMGVDVWEHAYYLKYQNKRLDYLQAWWTLVNWDVVAKNYAKAVA